MRLVHWSRETRKRKILSGVGLAVVTAVGIPVILLAWWLFSPLFSNTTVDEEFPLTVNASMPVNVTRAEAETMMQIAAKINSNAEEAMPAAMAEKEAAALSTGEFADEDFFHKGSGQATIYRLGDGSHVLRLENLSVTNGPDLHVLLLKDPAGRDKDLGYIDVGSLKGSRGNQNYEIPDGEDAASYRSVMIYCQPFHVIFSTAQLAATATPDA